MAAMFECQLNLRSAIKNAVEKRPDSKMAVSVSLCVSISVYLQS